MTENAVAKVRTSRAKQNMRGCWPIDRADVALSMYVPVPPEMTETRRNLLCFMVISMLCASDAHSSLMDIHYMMISALKHSLRLGGLPPPLGS